ncbi:MAG: hypothetical protein MI739_02710 [Bacteroidales bacterium]|nr:hypothetical protein [Bacteroidales bacterium]
MLRKIIFILTLFISTNLTAQNLSNIRYKSLKVDLDTILVDSLSIVPGSEIISYRDKILNKNDYSIDYPKSVLTLSQYIVDSINYITIRYRVFPINFAEHTYFRKTDDVIITGPVLTYPKERHRNTAYNFFNDNQIDKRGSISRGITIGNNQDAVINSNLNLQMSGKLSQDMYIMAAISDKNIPIQPEGNSQQIQEFDKIFIQLYNDKTKLVAGNFEIYKPSVYFMNVNKKGLGALFSSKIALKNKKSLQTTVSGAISRGKYCRKKIQGQEGNQGPYKITGCENEQFIIILSATERVFINGKLLKRGKENDYTIDYNTGELTFTANNPITKDSRISVEFEYTERSYSRFFIYSENEIKISKGKVWINVFSEQDSKNQPINQSLTSDQKKLLSEIGDNIEKAVIPNVDSVEFRSDYVLYEKTDTLVNKRVYSIYRHSKNPRKAYYQVGFSLTPDNKGDYIQVQNSANGKVFKWVAPINNIPQGNYQPVRLLVSPKKQQMLDFGSELKLNARTQTNFEVALSNKDVNTFSSIGNSDNAGYAIKLDVTNFWLIKDTLKNNLNTTVSYRLINKNFEAIERFRPIEFERDWNIVVPFTSDEHLGQFNVAYKHKNDLRTRYGFDFLSGNDYLGYKNNLGLYVNKSKFDFTVDASLLNTNSDFNTTRYIKSFIDINKELKFIKIGANTEQEYNKWKSANDSLQSNSFNFDAYKIYITNPESYVNKYSLSYTLRNDYLPSFNKFSHATKAEDLRVNFGLLKNPASILKAGLNYRTLDVRDTSLVKEKAENTLTGRLDYSFKLFKGIVSSLTFYEAGSGLEPKREYSYLKVTDGQGTYAWTDYNENKTAELNEFEVAKFQDQANYIRVYTTANNYIKTNKNEFSQTLNINPYTNWRSKKGLRKILSHFSNSFAYLVKQKTTNDDINSFNPFYKAQDTTIINLEKNLRNTFSFNRSHTKYGVDYIFQENGSKLLLLNGIEERNRLIHALNARFRFLSDFTIQNKSELGFKKYKSEFFSKQNYTIKYSQNDFAIIYQPGFKTRIKLNYKYNEKRNTLSIEKSYLNNLGLELSYSISKKGTLRAKFDYLKIKYNSTTNTPIAYEILEGLKPGNNGVWNFQFQMKLAKNLEMNINYDGRISETTKTIHTGNVQLRAFF